MKYELPLLPYSYEALEPYLDAATVEIHYSKHHQTYIQNLNLALEGIDLPENTCLGQLCSMISLLPEEKQTALRNNAGGALNHKLYWESMTPGGSKSPQGDLLAAIEASFGSFESFKEQFEKAGLSRFGSGWVWLIKKEDGSLAITTTPNQDNPVMTETCRILLGNDVWEHAYYLKYQNRRAEYLKNWWSLINWDIVEKRFQKPMRCACVNK